MKGKTQKKGLSKTVYVGLILSLMFGGLPAAPPSAHAAIATPGGVDSAGLRVWLKADPASMTLNGDSISKWKDSGPRGNDFANDGTNAAIASRPKPKYVAETDSLNFQPTVKFTRGSNGSILQDIDGVFDEGEVVNNASLFTITGGSPAMANSSIFNQPVASGSLGAYIPHITNAEAGKGNVLLDVGTSATRLTAANVAVPNDYNLWGLHFDANPTVGSNVYQSITKDGKQEAKGTQSRSPMSGKANTAASLGSAATGGSGYEGNMGELILFTNPLTAIQKRQVETYLAIKFGMTLKEGDYLSAGPSPQIVWDAAANSAFSNHIAGIGLDQIGALNQTQSRSSQKDPAQQVIITAKQSLADKQYLIWGDNDSQAAKIPYGANYQRLSRTWKVQNTGQVGTVQVAVPASLIPLGGVLLTSNNSNFEQASAIPMVEAALHGDSYYIADASLSNGSYFTFAEKLPEIPLTNLEIWSGASNVLTGFLPGQTGYEAVVPQSTDKLKIVAQASSGTNVSVTLTNYLETDLPITNLNEVPIVPGVNKLKIALTNGSSNNVYKVDIYRQLAVGQDGQLMLNGGNVTASSFQPNTNYVPANVVDGNWEDPESRWSASGQGQWLQFDLGQHPAVTYLQIAFLNARERQSTFEILESNDPTFATSTVLLAKRKSRSLQSTDSLMQPYVLDKPNTARYLRFVGYGNTAAGSSGNWNSMTELAVYTGTPPVIVEPEEPTGPPKAGDVPEGPPPTLDIINVSTAEQLQTALDQAKPGIEIRLKSGSYEQDGPFVIKDKQGTAALPIRITAAEQGGAIIKGNSYLHIENSNYVEVSGLVFNSGIGTVGLNYRGIDPGLAAELKGEDSASTTVPKAQIPYGQVHPGLELNNSSNISVLRNKFALDETGQPYRFSAPNGVGNVWCLVNIEGSCRIGGDRYIADRPVYTGDTPFTNTSLTTDNGTARHFIRVEGISSHNRIAYNDIGGKKGFGATMTYNGKAGHNISEYDIIEYNYFHDIGPRVTNGLEAIRLGLSGLSLASGHVTIQHNLFEGLNGEDEIISVKSSDNIIRYNTIRNSYGGIVARHGHRNSFYGNFLFGDGKTPGYSGFRIYGNGHKIFNNYMEGLTTNVIRLDGGTHDGGPDGGTNPTVRWLEGSTERTAVLNTLTADEQTEILRGHWRQYNVEIFNNTMVNTGNNTPSYSFGGRTYQPVGTKIYNNVVFSNAGVMFNETTAAQNVPESERQVYVGNLVEGTANPTNISNASRVPASAIEKKPLYLVRSADGLVRLSANSPAIDASKAPYLPQMDMDGQIRYNMPDAGADEYDRQNAPVNRPLTAADVGPNAGRPVVEEGNAELTALKLEAGYVLAPSFSPNVTSYQVTVPAETSSISVIPTAKTSDFQITVSVDGGGKLPVISGQPSSAIAITKGTTEIRIEVALPSGKSKTYTIMVQREDDNTPPSPSIDSIQLGEDTYNLKVNGTQAAAVYAVYQGNRTLLTGASFATANPQIASVNSQGIVTGVSQGTTVLVETYNQYTTKATVVVTEDKVEGEAGLSGLTISPVVALSPTFSTNTTSYQAVVPYNVSRLTLQPTAVESSSIIAISVDGANRQTVQNGQALTLELAAGNRTTEIRVEVTLPSGKSKTYTIIAQRENDSTPPSPSIDSIQLGEDTYNLKVNGTQAAAVYAVYQGSKTLLTGASFTTTNSEIASVNSQGIVTGVSQGTTVLVATYNQYTTKATVVVTEDKVEGEAGLSGLTISPVVALSPTFSTNTTSYQAVVPYNVSRLTLQPTAVESSSIIAISVDGANRQTVQNAQALTLELAAGSRTITVDVSLPSGKNKVYTITVQRTSSSGRSSGGSSGGSGTTAGSGSPTTAPSTEGTVPSVPADKGTQNQGTSTSKTSFSDVAGHWAGSAIGKAIQLGIVNGYPDGTFKPDEPMTRLQFAVLLVRALKVPASSLKTQFADNTDIPAWASSELAAAVQAGIIQGYEDDTLRPNHEINRAEMITMLVRSLKPDNQSAGASLSFADSSEIPEWAKSSISFASSAGLVQGKEGNSFLPNDIASRAEAVTVIMRMLEHK